VLDPAGKTKLAKNPQPIQPVPDSDDELPISANDKMLPEESGDPELELPVQEPETFEKQELITLSPKRGPKERTGRR